MKVFLFSLFFAIQANAGFTNPNHYECHADALSAHQWVGGVTAEIYNEDGKDLADIRLLNGSYHYFAISCNKRGSTLDCKAWSTKDYVETPAEVSYSSLDEKMHLHIQSQALPIASELTCVRMN